MIVLAIAMQALSAGVLGQSSYDDDAARAAASMHGRFRPLKSVVVASHVVTRSDSGSRGWRTVTDDEMRLRSSYQTPKGYRFRKAVNVDLDHDGRIDVVEMVERLRQVALRISYGRGGRVVVANIREGRWTDQSLFAAGADAVMVNFPESSAYFLFQRGRQLRVEYSDD